jgi:MFS family permease
MLAVLALASLLVSFQILLLFYVSLFFSGTGQAVLRVVITGQAAAAADPAHKGETIGILSALMSAYMIVAPVVSGYLYEAHHAAPYIASTILLLMGIYFAVRFKKLTKTVSG